MSQWRQLTRAATSVAILTSPAVFVWFKQYNGWSTLQSLAATFGTIVVFRGFADLIFRRLIPSPSLFGARQPAPPRGGRHRAGAAPGSGASG